MEVRETGARRSRQVERVEWRMFMVMPELWACRFIIVREEIPDLFVDSRYVVVRKKGDRSGGETRPSFIGTRGSSHGLVAATGFGLCLSSTLIYCQGLLNAPGVLFPLECLQGTSTSS